jgi:hypothetical protein
MEAFRFLFLNESQHTLFFVVALENFPEQVLNAYFTRSNSHKPLPELLSQGLSAVLLLKNVRKAVYDLEFLRLMSSLSKWRFQQMKAGFFNCP